MELTKIMSLLQSSGFCKSVHFYKFIVDNTTKQCACCLRLADMVFADNDPAFPILPLHPNCDCSLVEVDITEFQKQKEFQFGEMSHDQWDNQSDEEKHLWCNCFRLRFGEAIDKYAKQYNIPKQLLAGVVANEMLDWKFPDGTWLDGITGGGVGYAQIAIKTAKAHGIQGSDDSIRAKLNSYNGSIEIAAKIMSDYLTEFQQSVKNDKLGPGFEKSTLYYMPNPSILDKADKVQINVPEWLLNSMCAVWNSGIEVIYAKDPIGADNYRNAFYNGLNSNSLMKYLPKLVNK